MPLVFVREDNYVPVAALGFGEPYALVLSSHWIEVFRDDELAFMIGRELGHIAAGHTRFLSLLSVNGKENPLISLIFGGWLRRCTMTCDKVGLLCCGTIDAAIRAIGVAEFHEFGRKVDYQAFAEQHAEIEADNDLALGRLAGQRALCHDADCGVAPFHRVARVRRRRAVVFTRTRRRAARAGRARFGDRLSGRLRRLVAPPGRLCNRRRHRSGHHQLVHRQRQCGQPGNGQRRTKPTRVRGPRKRTPNRRRPPPRTCNVSGRSHSATRRGREFRSVPLTYRQNCWRPIKVRENRSGSQFTWRCWSPSPDSRSV